MKNINVRFLNHEGDNTVAMEIGAAVEAIVKEYLTKKCRPYLGKDPFMFTATNEKDPAIYQDTADLRARLEEMPDGLTVTLGTELLGGADINPQELAAIISSSVLAALEKANIMEAEVVEEDEEVDDETQVVLNQLEAFENAFMLDGENVIVISRDALSCPVDFLEFTVSLRTYLQNVRKINELGADYPKEVVIKVA
jgi:hypothetical protein